MANLRVDKITSTETFETTGSVQFDGDGDRLSVPAGSDFAYGTNDFTIEAFVCLHSLSASYYSIYAQTVSGTNYLWIAVDTDGTLQWWNTASGGGDSTKLESAEGVIQTSTWHHIAICRSGSILKGFVDGNEVMSYTNTFDFSNTDRNPSIGNYTHSTAQSWNGHISNFRVIKGQALYTSNFKPPMRELENVPGTVLLACQSKTDASLEKTGKTITVNGNAVANELTPGLLTPIVKSGGGSAITGSVEFDGGTSSIPGSYLTVPNTTDLRLGSSDFTVEAWVNFSNGAVSNGVIAALWDNTNNQRSWNLYFDRSGNNLYFAGSTNGSSGNNNVSTSIDIEDSNWYHVAASRSGSTIKLFVNGIESGSNTSVGTYYDNTTDLITIGAQNHDNLSSWWKGFISNLRIVKGTALYTDDFTPPTRELKRVPGTVLLCCQDPDNPLTEVTGKTITGYGDLDQVYNTQLVTNGTFDSDASGWTALNSTLSVSSGQLTITNNGASNGRATGSAFKTTIGARYILKYDAITSGGSYRAEIRNSTGAGSEQAFESTTDGATETFEFQATESQHTVVIYSIGADGVATKYDNVYVSKVNPGKTGSNFTPQVGDDRQVTFEGVTKINTDAYFCLPTGNTESRDKGAGTRGISFAGSDASNKINTINHINISTTGNAKDFGDLLDKITELASAASSTRGISAGGVGTSPTANEIDTVNYITMASTGDALDFGDLTVARRLLVGCSSQTRGIFAGGYDAPNKYNTMDYITIASTGDALDFGDMVADGQTASGRYGSAGYASPTRGVWHGGYGYPAYRNIIDYVTISSKGNTKDFGDSAIKNYYMGGCSNSIRGISGGAFNPSPATHLNFIEYTTIATTGNAKDFGDLVQKAASTGACASQIRGVFLGGIVGGSKNNSISYVTIMTMGNALDFGDLTTVTGFNAGCSNGHGGLG